MAKRTPAEVYASLRQAGFSPAAAVTMDAVAGAESGWDDAAVGDVRLENTTWGPSYGLFQIRTLKGQTGTGSDRDIAALAGNDARQAKSALDISSSGRDFSPWTTYTNGAFQRFLGQVSVGGAVGAAAGAATGGATTTGSGTGINVTPAKLPGPNWLPWNWGNALSDQASGILGGVRNLGIEVAFAGLGLALVYMGALTLARPTLKEKESQLRQVATAVI